MQVTWVRCGEDNHWCNLETLQLKGITAKGVYIIWRPGKPSRVVRVGQGDIAERLARHRTDEEILAHKSKGGRLLITWASVSAAYRERVERYLANKYSPLVGQYPNVAPLEVNLPAS